MSPHRLLAFARLPYPAHHMPLAFSSGLPVLLPIATLAFVLTFWIDKISRSL